MYTYRLVKFVLIDLDPHRKYLFAGKTINPYPIVYSVNEDSDMEILSPVKVLRLH